jgi:hypothetical protein
MSGFLSNLLGGAPATVSGGLSSILGVGPRQTGRATTPLAPPSTEAAREELISRTRGFAAEPFQPYVDQYGNAIPRVAQFTPDQQRAFESTRNLATQAGGLSGLTPELAQQAIAATRGVATTLPETDIQAYMSPYTQGVIDPMVRAIEERAAKERLALGQQAARTGSFGGSRQAIAESELSRGTQRNIAETTAAERAKAYNQALDQFRKDQAAIPQLYGAMQGQLGTGLQQTQGALGSMVNPLLATGGLQQAREQANLDVLRQQYEEERDFPLRGISALRSTLALPSVTLGIGQQQTESAPGRDIFSALTGAISQGPSFLEKLNELGQGLGLGTAFPSAELARLNRERQTQGLPPLTSLPGR